jgi:hypothetical protein
VRLIALTSTLTRSFCDPSSVFGNPDSSPDGLPDLDECQTDSINGRSYGRDRSSRLLPMMSLRQYVLAPARGEQAMRIDGGSVKPRGIRLLMSSLVSLSGGCLGAGVLGLGLPSRDLALCGRLVLLGASFGFE